MSDELRISFESRPPSRKVTVERVGDEWVVSDEGGEFARATHPEMTLQYVACLLYGPGTGLEAYFRQLLSLPADD